MATKAKFKSLIIKAVQAENSSKQEKIRKCCAKTGLFGAWSASPAGAGVKPVKVVILLEKKQKDTRGDIAYKVGSGRRRPSTGGGTCGERGRHLVQRGTPSATFDSRLPHFSNHPHCDSRGKDGPHIGGLCEKMGETKGVIPHPPPCTPQGRALASLLLVRASSYAGPDIQLNIFFCHPAVPHSATKQLKPTPQECRPLPISSGLEGLIYDIR